jgi:hypothetical protein
VLEGVHLPAASTSSSFPWIKAVSRDDVTGWERISFTLFRVKNSFFALQASVTPSVFHDRQSCFALFQEKAGLPVKLPPFIPIVILFREYP